MEAAAKGRNEEKGGKKRSEKASRRWSYGATGIPQNCARGHPQSVPVVSNYVERELLLPFPLVIFSPRSETLSLRAVCRWARNRVNKIALLRYFDEMMSIFDKAESFI